jgi:hypothetical protein
MGRAKEKTPMSKQTRRAILDLIKSVDKNTPRIKKALTKRGKKADPVLVFVAAQYLDCLNRLAKGA